MTELPPKENFDVVYKEIDRRSEAQEKAIQFNLLSLAALLGWLFTYGKDANPAIYLVMCIVNCVFGLKWLSEDRNIAGLAAYLKEAGAPLRNWQSGKFYSIYSSSLRIGDFAWRSVAFVVPSGASFGVFLVAVIQTQTYAKFYNILGALIALACLSLVAYGFIDLWTPWPDKEEKTASAPSIL